MRTHCLWSVLPITWAVLGGDVEAQRPTPGDTALRDSLVGIYLDWSQAWEPQRGSQDDAIKRAHPRAYFVVDATFASIIDAKYRDTFQELADRIPVSIANTYRDYREQHHSITATELLRMGSDGAALTLMYCVDFVRTDGRRGIVNSGATMVFLRTPRGWRIAHYHGSHGQEVFQDVPCSGR